MKLIALMLVLAAVGAACSSEDAPARASTTPSVTLTGPPLPDPDPSVPKGTPRTWVAYDFFAPSKDGRYMLKCHVPVPPGKRTCKVVRKLRNGR